MNKVLFVVVGMLTVCSLFAGGQKANTSKADVPKAATGEAAGVVEAVETVEITVYGLKGPSGIGMVKMFEDGIDAPGYKVTFQTLAQADLMAAQLISGEAKVGILPPNVPAKIASTGKNLQIAAVVGTGMLSLLTSDPKVTKIEELRGKRIAVAGQGAVPEFVFRKILASHGLSPDIDVTLDFSLAYPEIAQSLIAGRIETALLPEPFATMARNGRSGDPLREPADIQAEWVKTGGEANYPMTALVVDGTFAANNPAFMKALLAAYQRSLEWVRANSAEAGTLAEKHELGLRAPIVAASIPRSNFVYASASEARPSIEALFRVFLEYAPASIGGKLPGAAFYYGQ
ncbi:MAG: ABC transporter substrate-binding protein [Spirochaetaceae bacterium]|jgi:NitT/TauT family transport system substrate-binding protein|nr:ABC transporter substrate-binding protein [Spirochaetaceae bacterium]